MKLDGADLGRRAPPHAWEGYFLIAVFPRGSRVRWCKVQLFGGGRDPRRHCLSAVEGMDGPGKRLVLVGTGERVELDEQPLALAVGDGRWDVRADGLAWSGDFPRLALEIERPALRAETASDDVLWWVRTRMLSYFSAFGRVALDLDGERLEGASLVEHAWGADTRLPVSRLVPARWHWDVLAFEGGATAAGLELPIAGGYRSGGRAPGAPFSVGRGLRTRVGAWRVEAGRAVPAEWSGELRLGERVVRYRARASTPVAPVVPHGGFLGFEFDGELDGRPVAGTGFCEYAHKR